MNQYPSWKYLLIFVVITIGVVYALPNLFGNDPAVQVTGSRTAKVDNATLTMVTEKLKQAGIEIKSAVLDKANIKIRLTDAESQLKVQDLIQETLGVNYTVALNLIPATPQWLKTFDAKPMYLGLDLRGGVHFLMQVDIRPVLDRSEASYVSDVRREMQKQKIRYKNVRRVSSGNIEIYLPDSDSRDRAERIIKDNVRDLEVESVNRGNQLLLVARMREEVLLEKSRFALEQNMTSLRNRVNLLGVAEPIIQQQGKDRIVVQLPGIQDTAEAKKIIGSTATLEFRMVDEEHDAFIAMSGSIPAGAELYKTRDGVPILLKKRIIYSGDNIVDAAPGFDSLNNTPIVSITLDSYGAKINQKVTGKNINKRMAVIFIETKSITKRDKDGNPVLDKDGREVSIKRKIKEVITAPVIRSQLGKRYQIEGLDSVEEANELSLLLRAGALAAPIDIVEERTVGPSLGQDNINRGFTSIMIGFVAIMIFMVVYYRVFGLVANLALTLNLVLIIAVLSIFQATLTLPGIAGILLTVGMAVDANVLIFERIREEIRNGSTPQASIHAGYAKAFSTIFDANITTLIAAFMLFNFGTGPIKGFAITLCIGILTSMFTAIFAARGMTNLLYGGRSVKALSI